jgi:hypothetical protein
MDPFIEGQVWEDFHHWFLAAVAQALIRQVRPRYIVRVGHRVYVSEPQEERVGFIRPDVALVDMPDRPRAGLRGGGTATMEVIAPVQLTVPMPQRQREAFLTVREPKTGEIVCVIEVLSPSNERRGDPGHADYLNKREQVLGTAAHFVEIDLLRGGERWQTVEPLPPGDYYAFVSRRPNRPHVDVYSWSLRCPLPAVPIPLGPSDADATLDLQAAFTAAYDAAGYDYSLDYSRPVEPPLSAEDAAWVQEVLQQAEETDTIAAEPTSSGA